MVASTPRRARSPPAPAPTCSSPGAPSSGTSVHGRRRTPSAPPWAAPGEQPHPVTPAPPRAVVAAGGIIGTWHAYELVQAGFAVEHLEADAGPTGASVRNFGLVWVSGRRSGEELEVARRARRRWEEVGASVAELGFRANGSLTVAT